MAGEAHHSISSNGGTEWKAARENAGARSFQTCATSSSTVSGRHSLARFQKFGREALARDYPTVFSVHSQPLPVAQMSRDHLPWSHAGGWGHPPGINPMLGPEPPTLTASDRRQHCRTVSTVLENTPGTRQGSALALKHFSIDAFADGADGADRGAQSALRETPSA